MKVVHAVIVFLMVSLAGCGGGGGSPSETTAESSSSTLSSGSSAAAGSSVSASVSEAASSSVASADTSTAASSQDDVSSQSASTSSIEFHFSSAGYSIGIDKGAMAAHVSFLEVEHIGVKEIGGSKENYRLQAGRLAADTLATVGESDVGLKNRDDPVELKNAVFYRVETTFASNAAAGSAIAFTITLVSTDKNNPFTRTLAQAEVTVTGSSQRFVTDVLVPGDLASGEYLLVVSLVNDALEATVSENKKITDMPQIGAVYAHISAQPRDRYTAVLDVNTTKYMDTPYLKNIRFANDFLQRASGKGRFLFSNIDTKDVSVVVRADLELSDGSLIPLGLLDSASKTIKNEVVLTLPHYDTNDTKLFIDNLFDTTQLQIGTDIQFKTAPAQHVGSESSEAAEQIKEVSALMQQAFIPFVKHAPPIGEKRYRVTLSYYIPKDSYETVVKVSPDLSLTSDGTPADATVHWKFTFLDKKTAHELAAASLQMTKFKDIPTASPLDGITFQPISIVLPKPVDAALDMPDGTAYIFSGHQCAVVDPQTGERTGEWKDASEVFDGTPVLLSHDVTAALRTAGNIDGKNDRLAYFFYANNEKYLSYDLDTQAVVGVYDNKNIAVPGNLLDAASVGACMQRQLHTYKIDAAFRDGPDYYFVAGDRYMQLAYASDVPKVLPYRCEGGRIADKEEWKSVNALPITAALSDHQDGRGRIRFYLNGFQSKAVLNRPDIFLDDHNGFEADIGDSDVASVSMQAEYGVSGRWIVPGVHGYADVHLDLYLFSYPIRLFNASASAYGSVKKLHPYIEEAGASVKSKVGTALNIEALGYTFVNEDDIEEIDVTAKLGLQKAGVRRGLQNVLIPKPDYDGGIVSWKEEYEVFKQKYPVGPIMLAVAGSVSGELEIKSPVFLDDRWEQLSEQLSVKPSATARIKGILTGGIDYDVVKAGVKGDVNIVEIGAAGELRASLEYVQEHLDFNVGAKIDGHFGIVKAQLAFFAGTKTHIRWCSAWGVPYPCGLGWDIWDIPIYETPWLYSYNPTILDVNILNKQIPLI